MTFETTLYVHNSVLKRINEAMEITNSQKTALIVYLLKYAMNDYSRLEKQKCTVKYQSSDSSKNWKRVHVWFSDTEYVFCLDMRRLFRMSVSALLAYAVGRYLDVIIEKILRKKNYTKVNDDNYPFSTYEFKRKINNTTIFWIQIWKKSKRKLVKR